MGTIIRDMIIEVNVMSALDEINVAGSSPQIFPNPATSAIGIKWTSSLPGLVTILNANGEIVKSETVSSYNSFIDIRQLSSGTYFVRLNDSTIGRFIKQ